MAKRKQKNEDVLIDEKKKGSPLGCALLLICVVTLVAGLLNNNRPASTPSSNGGAPASTAVPRSTTIAVKSTATTRPNPTATQKLQVTASQLPASTTVQLTQNSSTGGNLYTFSSGLDFEITTFEMRADAGSMKPRNGAYLLLLGNLRNKSSNTSCIYARDVRLTLDGTEYRPQDAAMDAVQKTLDPFRDYIGSFAGHCVKGATSVPTFAVFDVPAQNKVVTLSIRGELHHLEVTWALPGSVVAAPTSAPAQAVAVQPTPLPKQPTQASVQVAAAPSQEGDLATVTRIVDGDTINVSLNGTNYSVRYIGVNTTERGEPCYKEGTEANRVLVEGKTVRMVKDVSQADKYGRLLRYIYVGDTFVNAELVRQGYAEAAKYPPDTAHAAEFEQLEAEAHTANIGCHPLGVFGAPVSQVVQATAAPGSGIQEEAAHVLYATSGVNARQCARTDCTVLAKLTIGMEVTVNGWIHGTPVNGNDIWRRATVNGKEVYIHSIYLSPDKPTSPPVIVQQPAQPPAQQLMSTVPPAPMSQAPAQQWDCSGNFYNCPYFENKCDLLRSYWAACPGDPSRLDGNPKDGVPCEKQCGG
jgi:micrococcal nuclease